MTLHSKADLSADEIRLIENQLVSRGFRQADRDAAEMREREYSVNRYRARRLLTLGTEKFSICWRN